MLQKMHVLGIILSIVNVMNLTSALIGYDCSNSETNLTVISMRDVATCKDKESDYKEENATVVVLQRNDFKMQRVWTCLIEVNRHIQHCGMHSHSSAVAAGLSNYVYTLGAERCRDLHKYRTVKIHNQVIGGISMNGTTTAAVTLLGHVSNDAKCKGTIYTENGHSWDDVIIQAAVKITTKDYLATVKLEDNELTLVGGVTCQFLQGYCIDSSLGESVWEYSMDSVCDKDLSLLYKGKAKIISYHNKDLQRILVVEESEKIFALSLVKSTTLCGYNVWQTEHPKIMVLREEGIENISPKMEMLPQNTNLLSYINSKLLYTEQAYKRTVDRLYTDTLYRRCLTHREILKNRLMLAPLTPNALSMIIKNKMGYVGRVLGEALYIMQCTPRVVAIRRTKYCYNELPITVNNRSKFLAPITHLILDHATQVSCERLTPPMYYIDGTWIGLSPDPIVKNSPAQLEPEVEPTLIFQPIQPLGHTGLYSQEEIERVQQLLTFGVEREAVENIVVRKMAQLETDNQGYSSLHIFDGKEIQKLARNTLEQLYGWFTDIGIFFSGIIGIYIILKAVKYLLGVILNGLSIYKTFGCGFALCASLWNTLTLFIMHHKSEKERKMDNREEAENLNKNKIPQPSAPRESILEINEEHNDSTTDQANPQQSSTVTLYSNMAVFQGGISNIS